MIQREFSKETYMYWYESMQLMRKFEEKAGQLYGMQKIKGFCHLYIGQEACASGAVSALRKGDKWITAYRDHGHPLGFGNGSRKPSWPSFMEKKRAPPKAKAVPCTYLIRTWDLLVAMGL